MPILDLCIEHTLETTMADYQFANVFLALLDLTTTLNLNLVTLLHFTYKLYPAFLLHLSIHGLKSARNGGFGSCPVKPADGTLSRVGLLSMKGRRKTFACQEHNSHL